MSDVLSIALVSPHAWPPRDDVAHHVAAEARALADRGHRVTILAPSTERALVAAGRAVLLRAHSGEPEALILPPGTGARGGDRARAPHRPGAAGGRALRPGGHARDDARARPVRRGPPPRAPCAEPGPRRAAPRARGDRGHLPPGGAAGRRGLPAPAGGPGPRARRPADRDDRGGPRRPLGDPAGLLPGDRPGRGHGPVPAPPPGAGPPGLVLVARGRESGWACASRWGCCATSTSRRSAR